METMEGTPVHTMMYNAIGFLYWSAGEYGQARSYLEKAVSNGRKFGKSLNLAWGLNYLGATALAQRDHETAHSCLEEAFQMATGMGSAGKHIIGWALAFLGDIPFSNREFAKAQSMYELSVMAFGEVGNLNLKAIPVRRLGYLALYHDDKRKAAEFFKESLLLNHKLRHQLGTIGSIAAFGGLAFAEADYTRSAKLLGAVEANLEAMALSMLPFDRLEYSHSITNLKNQLDEQALTDAWTEGRAMSLEDAVEFALEE
jgi:tetratricopeptide (TPR) repeat protein